MHIDKHQDGQHTRLRISGEITIYEATALQSSLLASLSECDTLELDLTDVSELDTAGFQQLYLLQREARRANKSLRISAHSAATRDVLDLLHMHAHFADAA
jgi:anti-sigma B factor antagonist